MRKLIRGIVDFRKNLTEESRTLFAKLALGQKPDALFIACSDSRVVPNLFASSNPGDLFVLRNVGNLIPSASSTKETSALAAIEFSIFSLNITDIIICGHSECGAMHALTHGLRVSNCPHLESWLEHGAEAVRKVKNGFAVNASLSLANQVSQVNVIQQMHHLESYPFIQERLKANLLRIHGWWFDIALAEVYSYECLLKQFILIDEVGAEKVLERLG